MIKLPAGAAAVIRTLEKAGFEAYAVGGCVRDALLGREAYDWDITTNASPAQVKSLFRHTIDTGIAHGTVTVSAEGGHYEVTTYRVDGAYLDGRHPASVSFTASLREDLRRRDFTVNAMAYHPVRGLVDLFHGQEDLNAGIIRCVGEARERFLEDGLRMLRGIRFSAQLGFAIEEKTQEAMRELAPRLALISRERVRVELDKILLSAGPDRLLLAARLGLAADFLPAFAALPAAEQEERIHWVACLPAKLPLRLAALYAGKPGGPEERETEEQKENEAQDLPAPDKSLSATAAKELRALKYDNSNREQVVTLLSWAHTPLCPAGLSGSARAARLRFLLGTLGDAFFSLVRLQEAVYGGEEHLAGLEAAEQEARHILERGDCVSLKGLAVSGSDLIAAGIAPGKPLGACLQALLVRVLYHPEENNREHLIRMAVSLAQPPIEGAGKTHTDRSLEEKHG